MHFSPIVHIYIFCSINVKFCQVDPVNGCLNLLSLAETLNL